MSATNRGGKRIEADFYSTPYETIEALLKNYVVAYPGESILEPSAGNGIIIKSLRDAGYATNYTHAVEIRPEEQKKLRNLADTVRIGSFLDESQKFDVIIGNPPFSLAQQFVDKSLELLNPGGRLIFLLRTSFLESKKRFSWWQNKLPTKLYVLSRRPSFTGKGTDATSYSWFVWEKRPHSNDLKSDQQIKII